MKHKRAIGQIVTWKYWKVDCLFFLFIFFFFIIIIILVSFSKIFQSYHYENMPIQVYWKVNHRKLKMFRQKIQIFFHISAQNIDCGYSLEPPRRGGSNEYPQSIFFLSRNK